MITIGYDHLLSSLSNLKAGYAFYLRASKVQNVATNNDTMLDLLKEGCIQRFEVCYDVIRKHLKKYLRQLNGAIITDDTDGPDTKSVLAIAFKAGIITDADIWDTFNACRNNTSHEYSEDKAAKTFAIIPDFIEEAQELYQKMTTTP